jgi:hypothetical protein
MKTTCLWLCLSTPAAVLVFGSLRLSRFGAYGRLTIPIIVQDDADPVHAMSRRIAATITERVPAALDLRALGILRIARRGAGTGHRIP